MIAKSSIASVGTHKQSKKRSQKEPITYYELLELERQRNEENTVKIKIKRNFPLAPDGFIPNSVVRKFFKMLDAPTQPEKKIWKLKWVYFFLN
jgi:hypothetical protein